MRAALCEEGQGQGQPACSPHTTTCLPTSVLPSPQFAEVRSDAEARMAQLMGDIAQRLAARAGGERAVGADPTAELRGRLEAAIEVMQEGLVERDTEVRPLAHLGACTALFAGCRCASPVLAAGLAAVRKCWGLCRSDGVWRTGSGMKYAPMRSAGCATGMAILFSKSPKGCLHSGRKSCMGRQNRT